MLVNVNWRPRQRDTNIHRGPPDGGRSLATGATARASTSSAGEQATGGDSFAPSLSADGTGGAFVSNATNLVPGDTNGSPDVFVRDLSDLFALG